VEYWLTAAILRSAAFAATGATIPRATGASISCLSFINLLSFTTTVFIYAPVIFGASG
jgi:hypothetical protein